MKFIAPVLVIMSLFSLTDPNGFLVWVVREQIVSISKPSDCVPAAHAKVTLGAGTFLCVQESVETVIQKMDPTW